jgi:hypothetical protein
LFTIFSKMGFDMPSDKNPIYIIVGLTVAHQYH